MITINRNSFTYTLAAFPEVRMTNEPKNYCNFFWLLMAKVLILSIVCAAVGGFLGVFVAALAIKPLYILSCIAGVIGVLAVAIGVLYIGIKIKEGEDPVSAYIKAYKERHCPLVTYVDVHD